MFNIDIAFVSLITLRCFYHSPTVISHRSKTVSHCNVNTMFPVLFTVNKLTFDIFLKNCYIFCFEL